MTWLADKELGLVLALTATGAAVGFTEELIRGIGTSVFRRDGFTEARVAPGRCVPRGRSRCARMGSVASP